MTDAGPTDKKTEGRKRLEGTFSVPSNKGKSEFRFGHNARIALRSPEKSVHNQKPLIGKSNAVCQIRQVHQNVESHQTRNMRRTMFFEPGGREGRRSRPSKGPQRHPIGL